MTIIALRIHPAIGIARIGKGVDRRGIHVHGRIGQTNDYRSFTIIRLNHAPLDSSKN